MFCIPEFFPSWIGGSFLFSLTLGRPCEADPQMPEAVGQEGMRGIFFWQNWSRRGSARRLLGLREQLLWFGAEWGDQGSNYRFLSGLMLCKSLGDTSFCISACWPGTFSSIRKYSALHCTSRSGPLLILQPTFSLAAGMLLLSPVRKNRFISLYSC